MATTYYQDIQKLYVAYFNRPADTAGLAYWETVVEAAKGSTVAVSAAFSAEAEYKTVFAGLSNADIVNTVYQNLFGRAAEDAGKAYWADLLDKKAITIDKVVTQIATGAQGSDLTAYNNKVLAAQAFTTALDTPAEQAGYAGADALKAAKAFVSGITTNASLTAAVAPATLGASVAAVVAKGTPFTLVSGLNALDVATKAKADFLATADNDGDPKTSTDDITINGNVTTKMGALDAVVTGDYTGATAGMKAVLLNGQVAVNAATLADAQAAVTTANVNIAKVAGLSATVVALDAAKAVTKTANTADTNAQADLAAKVASYNVLNAAHQATVDPVTSEITIDGVKVVVVKDSALVLATGVTETLKPGITVLLSAANTLEVADKAVVSANVAQNKAQIAVDSLDLTVAAAADLKAMASAFTVVKIADGATPTYAQAQAEVTALDALDKSAAAIAATASATQAQKDAATAAHNALISFKALVTAFETDDNGNPLLAKLDTAKIVAKDAQTTIDTLTKAVAALDDANATAAQLNAVNGQVKAAQDAFGSHSLALPVSLDAAAAAIAVGTADADIFVAGLKDAQVINFGLLGSDSLYIGSQFTLNTGKLTTGNNSTLEAFIVSANSGADTKIVLEKTAFGSNAATPEVVTITLTGVDSTHVHLSNGIITVS